MLTTYTITILSLWLPHGLSIRCFECSSWNNSMCLDPTSYDRETLQLFLPPVECRQGVFSAKQENFFCRKMVQTVIQKGYHPEVRVTRGCGWVRSPRECYKADNEDHLETVCQCFSDECNGGAMTELNAAAILTAIGAIVIKLIF